MLYREFATPILFATRGAGGLIESIRDERVLLQLPVELEESLHRQFAEVRSERMLRMVLRQTIAPVEAELLVDANELDALYEGPEKPDFFHPAMLEAGFFRGWRSPQGELIAVAGTHTVSRPQRAATIGNVFVHAAHRNQGLGAKVVAATAYALQAAGIETIVLNVRLANAAARRVYEKLGFENHCEFFEGQAIAPKRR